VNSYFGYDGISVVAKNYYRFQNHSEIQMDILTINHGDSAFEKEVAQNGDNFFCIEGRTNDLFGYVKKLINVIKRGNYEIVHVHGNSATMAVELFAAKAAKVKCRIAHSHNTTCDHKVLHKILFPLFDWLCTAGFACSENAGKFLFPNKRFYVIRNGINTKAYRYDEKIRKNIRGKYGLENKFVIGNIGRLTYQKNQEFIIQLLGRLNDPSIMLLLVGSGENQKYLQDQARQLGIAERVIFTGNIDNVNEVLQAMDVFVFPSRFEGLGIAAIEAQANNLPCLISEAVPKEVEVTQNCSFISLNKIEKWIALIKSARDSNEKIRKNVLKAEVSLKEVADAGFDIAMNCRQILEIYRKLSKFQG